MRSETTARFFYHAYLIALEFVNYNLMHDQLCIVRPDQIFKRADNRLLPVVSGKVQPNARVNEQFSNHLVLKLR